MNIDAKFYQQNISGLIQMIHKKWSYDMTELDSPQVQKGSLIHANQSMWYIPFIKGKTTNKIISVDSEKVFDLIQHLFVI